MINPENIQIKLTLTQTRRILTATAPCPKCSASPTELVPAVALRSYSYQNSRTEKAYMHCDHCGATSPLTPNTETVLAKYILKADSYLFSFEEHIAAAETLRRKGSA